MKNFSMWFVTILLIVNMIFGIVGCKEPPVQIEPPVLDNPNVDVNPDDDLPQTGNAVEDTIAPSDVSNLRAINKDSSVLLTWTDATDNDILGYEVSWDKEAPINRAISLPENSMMVAIKSQGCYISNLKNGIEYEFTVKTVDFSGNKSSGLKVKITPTIIEKTPLQIVLTPNTVEKTKENVEITVQVTTDVNSSVKKILYKEGVFTKIDEVLRGIDITVTQKIIATKNTTYTIVATDTAGRREIQWITVDNIDIVPPAQVSNFKAEYNRSKKLIYVNWVNPTDDDFVGTILTYKKVGSKETRIELDKNTSSFTIENINSDGSGYSITICSIDDFGNTSSVKTIYLIASGTLKLTFNAGNGWIETELEEKVKSITFDFEEGEYIYKILEKFDFDVYGELNEEKNIWYAYKENDTYYDWNYEFIDAEGNILLEEDWIYKKLNEDTTLTLFYRKLIPITYNLNGGKSRINDSSDDIIEYQLEGLELNKNLTPYISEIYKEGYFLRGWTTLRNGDDYLTIFPNYPTTIYAKWEEPKTCSLILKSGEYSGFYNYETSLGDTIQFQFESGKSLSEVLHENDFYSDIPVNENEFLGKRFEGFKDSQGNIYYMNSMLTDSVELEAFTRDLYPEELCINLNFNGVNIEGYDEFCFYEYEHSYKEFLIEFGEIISEYIKDENMEYVFGGWTYTKDGDDFVDSLPWGTTSTIYAKWYSKDYLSQILPYQYSDDNSKVTFIFRPNDFGLDWSVNDNYTVKLMCLITDWDINNENKDFVLLKNPDGTYSVTFNYNEIADELFYWSGFQFAVVESGNWYGWPEFKPFIPDNKTMKEHDGDRGFKLELFSMSLSIDFNGGTSFDGETSPMSFEISWAEYDEKHFHFIEFNHCLWELGVQNPTKENHIFAGWTFTKDGTDYVSSKYNYLPYGNYTLYAKWIEEKECTLTLQAIENSEFVNKDGITFDTDLMFNFQAGMRLYEVLSYNDINPIYNSLDDRGYVLSHYVDEYDNEYLLDTILENDVMLYPVFKLVPRVTYNFNGGYLEDYVGDILVIDASDFEVDINDVVRDSYIFAGWTLTPDGNDFIYETAEDVTVYARWIRVTPESSTNVYSYTVPISKISEQWEGNSLKADFAVMVMTDNEVKSLTHDNIYRYNYDLDHDFYSKNLNLNTTRPGNFSIIDGIAATVTQTDVTVFVDMSKFYCENGTEGKKPYVVALVRENHAPEDYSYTHWGDTMIMYPEAVFPTNLQQQGVPSDMFTLSYVAGTMTDPVWEVAGIPLVDNSFLLESNEEEIQFKFNDGTWNCSYGILDGPVEQEGIYTLGGSGNIVCNLPEGTYCITLDVTEDYARVIVEKIEN